MTSRTRRTLVGRGSRPDNRRPKGYSETTAIMEAMQGDHKRQRRQALQPRGRADAWQEATGQGEATPNPTQPTRTPETWPLAAEHLVAVLRSAFILDNDLNNLRTTPVTAVLEALEKAEASLEQHHKQIGD